MSTTYTQEERELIRKVSERLTRELAKTGQLIELGFKLMIVSVYGPTALTEMPKDQLDQLRETFFAGAQHLFGSIMATLSEGNEPTRDDMRRMEMIQSELDKFIDDYIKRHNLPQKPKPTLS